MTNLRIGYLYSLSPIHCGGEGDLGNILEIAREVHTNFPYIPGSSLRGSIRDEVEQIDSESANLLFGKELDKNGQMGVHQAWFGDARLFWVPMRTMSFSNNQEIFTWVSCHSLVRDHAIATHKKPVNFPSDAVGSRPGTYTVADAQISVGRFSEDQKQAIALHGEWSASLKDWVKPVWAQNCIVLSDANFQVLMEHSLWTQIRNKIQDTTEQAGSAEVFWTDICIPRDTIFYYPWGYSVLKQNPIQQKDHDLLIKVLQGLIQVGGQANVGRGWTQCWVTNIDSPVAPLISEPTIVKV